MCNARMQFALAASLAYIPRFLNSDSEPNNTKIGDKPKLDNFILSLIFLQCKVLLTCVFYF